MLEVRKIITPVLPDDSACPLILRGRFRWCNPIIENLRKKRGSWKWELQITNYEFPFRQFRTEAVNRQIIFFTSRFANLQISKMEI
jgi:hypothetical protein